MQAKNKIATLPNLDKLEKKIGYIFKNKDLALEAFTHPSLKKVQNNVSYQRLEFLGDSVLSLAISDILYHLYKNSDEGGLSKRHTFLVCGPTLVKIATMLQIGSFILMDSGERNTGGKVKNSNLENALEALIGAIYVDSNYVRVKEFINKYWYDFAVNMQNIPLNSRSILQEWTQKKGIGLPQYILLKKEGSDHEPIFTVGVSVSGYKDVIGVAKSKKAAECVAATNMIKMLNI